jgi:hypothetical protein
MNSACALSGAGTVHMPCAFYRHFDKDRLSDALRRHLDRLFNPEPRLSGDLLMPEPTVL